MNQPSYRVTCGAVPNPQWSTQNFLSLDATNKRLNQTTADNSINLYLLNDLTTAANVDHGNDPEHGNPTLNSDANYVWDVQTFNQPVSVRSTLCSGLQILIIHPGTQKAKEAVKLSSIACCAVLTNII